LTAGKPFYSEIAKNKPDVHEYKLLKPELIEKFPKHEKYEFPLELAKTAPDTQPDPTQIGGDSAINQIAQGLAGLHAQVGQLASEVAQLRSKLEGE
jgi:X-X-X-Leu-X-X-Gly heptad repeat protein